ncbi:hypothetical protein L345_05715, partial [Ophiophagus hannah]
MSVIYEETPINEDVTDCRLLEPTMSSQYLPNLRIRLPVLLLLLEAALILIFGFFVSYDHSQILARDYPVFQDVNLMVIFGFAYFLAFLHRYGFSSIGFNLLLAALGVHILTAIMSITTVLISTGAILGKVNLMQLIWMAMIEVTVFTIESHVSVMHTHLFGAYFGLMVSWMLYHSSLSQKAEKERSRPISDMFAVLGTLFLWIFWPSFNSALITEEDKKRTAIYNTYFVMATSTIAAFSLSMATSKNGKLSMAHIQNATLAGGVALGFSASNIQQPWIAMVLGLAAGTISVLGMAYLQKHLDPAFNIHDTCGVLYTFGLPSLLGGIIHIIVILTNHSKNLSVFGYSALIEVGALSLSLFLSLFSGLLTGFILTCKLWKTPPVTKYFDDQVYWEATIFNVKKPRVEKSQVERNKNGNKFKEKKALKSKLCCSNETQSKLTMSIIMYIINPNKECKAFLPKENKSILKEDCYSWINWWFVLFVCGKKELFYQIPEEFIYLQNLTLFFCHDNLFASFLIDKIKILFKAFYFKLHNNMRQTRMIIRVAKGRRSTHSEHLTFSRNPDIFQSSKKPRFSANSGIETPPLKEVCKYSYSHTLQITSALIQWEFSPMNTNFGLHINKM